MSCALCNFSQRWLGLTNHILLNNDLENPFIDIDEADIYFPGRKQSLYVTDLTDYIYWCTHVSNKTNALRGEVASVKELSFRAKMRPPQDDYSAPHKKLLKADKTLAAHG